MSLRWPVTNVNITQGFGENPDYYKQFGQVGHNGVDLGIPLNTPVYAADDGTVSYEGWGQYHSWAGTPAGIWILLDNGGIYSGYAHLNKTVINKGQQVAKGQLLGYSGQTGAATGPHLHFETLPKTPNFNNGYAGRIPPTPFIGDDMSKTGLAEERILSFGVAGRNGAFNTVNSLGGGADDDLNTNHVGTETNQSIQIWYNSDEGKDWRENRLPALIAKANNADIFEGQIDTLNKQIAELKKTQGGIDQATKDAVTQTNSNVNWLVKTFKSIFNIKD